MNILLTGGSGFIGRNLVELLGKKYHIVAPTRAELDLFNSQGVANFFSGKKFDFVVHAASVGGNLKDAQVTEVVEKNTKMFSNLLEHRSSFGKMIFLGSGAEYDKRQSLVRIKESQFGLSVPEDSYGLAKYLCSKSIESQQGIINLRCFGVYGKYEDYRQRFISNNICSALLGRPLSVNQDAVFDYIYVNDLVKIIEHFIIHEPKQRFYNAASGRPQHLLEIAEVIKEICGASEIIVKKSGLNKEYSCDVSLLKQEMGEIPHTDLHQAISAMRDYYRERLSEIKQALN